MKHIGIVNDIDKKREFITNEIDEVKGVLLTILYQSYRVYGDELPLADWKVIRGGMRTFYWKEKDETITSQTQG